MGGISIYQERISTIHLGMNWFTPAFRGTKANSLNMRFVLDLGLLLAGAEFILLASRLTSILAFYSQCRLHLGNKEYCTNPKFAGFQDYVSRRDIFLSAYWGEFRIAERSEKKSTPQKSSVMTVDYIYVKRTISREIHSYRGCMNRGLSVFCDITAFWLYRYRQLYITITAAICEEL